ncbi:MAG TPA: hypothetical protein VJR26_13505 [Candidatus Acidoferrales bacterium]|nr:hypothetical protein [Candidatus Acidoferrales bacterium]
MVPLRSRGFAWSAVLKIAAFVIPIVWLVILSEPNAHAVPSYSRQTGLACSTCHYTPPELTPFGRKFKLDGYTFTTKAQVTSEDKDHNSGLHLLESFPLSVLFDASYSATKSPQPATQNGNFQFPQDASLFLAGAWGSHVGSFVQVTYDSQADHFSWDNTDIRMANNSGHLFGKPLTYGATFNNNPTVEDLWNSTPAWGYPWVGSSVAPSPSAAAIINGTLGQDVAGIGGYAMWNDHFYLDGTIYRSEHIGGPQPNPGTDFGFNIRGVAPYWRAAWQTSTENNNVEIGTYGMHMKSSPNTITGLEDSYTDWAVDFQYDRTIPQFKNDVLSFRGTYIRENSARVATFAAGGAAQPGNHLNTVQGNVEYHFGSRLSGTGGFFNVTGTADPLLYAPAPVTGSGTGSPASTGYTLNVSWWPEQNINLGVQYTGYLRFNGAGTNYDAAGRSAGANDTTYLLLRLVF